MPKSSASAKITPGKRQQIEAAVTLLRAHYGPVLAVWRKIPTDRQREFLEHSPLFARLFEGVL